MTQQIDFSPDWTEACLVDQTKSELARVTEAEAQRKRLDDRKYYNQAHDLLWIGAAKPVPPFIVYLSDLSPRLIRELHSLDGEDRQFALKQAAGRIFEDINPELYHNSISRVLWVKLQ